MENNSAGGLDFGSIDFTPDWARKDAGVVVGRGASRAAAAPYAGGGAASGGQRPFRRDGGGAGGGAGRGRFRDGGGFGGSGAGRDRRPPREPEPRFEGEIRILPETKALGTVIRKIQGDGHAFKLKDLAYFLLDNPSSVVARIVPAKGAGAFRQCRACGFVATDEEEVLAHAASAHLQDYYDAREVECEPPKGDFPCVAKCGLTGELLGPPNFHGYAAAVRDAARRNGMTEAEFRSRIVMVREQSAVDEWRKAAVKKTLWFPKGAAEDAQGMAREQAESAFRRTFAGSLLDSPKVLAIPADAAAKSRAPGLARAVAEALEAERRNPVSVCFALRGAFHHRKMHFFRVNDPRGQEFVSRTAFREFDANHAIPELAAVARAVEAKPCATAAEIAPDPESRKLLDWLVSTSHVVAFTNGVFSMAEKHPKYGPQWRKSWLKKEKKKTPAPQEKPPEPATEKESKDDETSAVMAE